MTEQPGDGSQAQQGESRPDRKPSHALPDGAERHPLIDLSRDPNPGKADHARPDDDE
ncbi:hypothetical protein NONO_c48120 [Nocardia nova SH22a]|uniref:Uncharacterized protein n=1 Tax=Nocardia nova SH22a TaxID=1415166 RepID=W5TQS4_9NOCA|nr:hypothetical protein [Nocardia nova]AHH19596.1 hypothetical protein NONO_c48120 [Nocardia nova SH22a]